MKRALILLIALCCCIIAKSDNILRVKYDFYFKKDSLVKGYTVDRSMCLDVIGNKRLFYSEQFFLMDSTYSAIADAGGGMAQMNDAGVFRYKDASRYFIDVSERKYVKYDRAILSELCGTGDLELPEWELTEECDSVCGMLCAKATARYLGRRWEVWYTLSVPVPAGPWLLWGTPGLIVKAVDEAGLFCFNMKEVGYAPSDRQALLRKLSDKNGMLHTYSNIRKMEMVLNRIKRSYSEDASLQGVPGAIYADDNGSLEKINIDRKYIPLIPDEYWEEQ